MKKENSFISTFVDGNVTTTIETIYDKDENITSRKTTFQCDNILDADEVFTYVVISINNDIAEGLAIVDMDKMVDAHQGVFVTYVARRK